MGKKWGEADKSLQVANIMCSCFADEDVDLLLYQLTEFVVSSNEILCSVMTFQYSSMPYYVVIYSLLKLSFWWCDISVVLKMTGLCDLNSFLYFIGGWSNFVGNILWFLKSDFQCRFVDQVNATIALLHPIHCTKDRKLQVEFDATTIPAFLIVFGILYLVLKPRRPKPKINWVKVMVAKR